MTQRTRDRAVAMAERAEIDIQFQAILQTLRDQGERQANGLVALATEVRELTNTVVRGQAAAGQNGKGGAQNGGWQTYATMLALFAALMAPTWGAMKDTRDDVQTLRVAAGEQKTLHTHDTTLAMERVTRMEEALTEVETQFSALGDIANLERQHALVLMDMLHQCPTCTIPQRNYWPLPNVGRGDGTRMQ